MRRLNAKPTRRTVVVTSILLVLAILLTTAFLERGWIRNSMLPWYGTKVAGADVNKTFDDSFTDFDQQLKADGVKLTQVHAVSLPCSTHAYHHFSATVQCKKSRVVYADTSIPSQAINNWPAIYRTLMAHMTDGKSRVASSSNVTPSTLFTFVPRTTGLPENHLRVAGQQGAVQCSVDILASDAKATATPAELSLYSNAEPQFFMTESCTRSINFFGGWRQ